MRLRRSALLAAVVSAVLLGGTPALAAGADAIDIGVTIPESTRDTDGDSITNAELRWGLNPESSSGSYAGGCNFLSAGKAGDAGSARVWDATDGFYSAEQGAVSIVKATSGGGWETPTFDTKCLDASGTAVTASSVTSTTQSQVVIDGGSGSATADGGLTLSWTGSFSVVFYGGMTYWSASNPQLQLDASGNGQLTATASGYGASMDDLTKWEPLAERTIVLAQLSGVSLGVTGGFASIPDYLGVSVSGAGQSGQTAQNASYWGAFPASFIDFQKATGQAGYWLSTGGLRDAAKPASILTVNYDAEAPAIVPAPSGGLESVTPPSNPLTFRPDAAAVAGTGAAAVPVAVPPSASGIVSTGSSSPTSLTRDNGLSLVPEAINRAFGPLALPIAGAVLAALVSLLTFLQMTGRLIFPWSRPKVTSIPSV